MSLTKKEIEKKVIEILAERLDIGKKKINSESRLIDDLGLGSFGAMERVFEE